MVPMDLKHREHLSRALRTAAERGQHGARVIYVGVTPATPTSQGHNPAEFQKHPEEFAAEEARAHGHSAGARTFASHDPSVDLNDTLLEAAEEIGADLIVMASHIPNVADHLWPSHGEQPAKRAKASVFVVR